jgi:hypothetical protein
MFAAGRRGGKSLGIEITVAAMAGSSWRNFWRESCRWEEWKASECGRKLLEKTFRKKKSDER